LAPLVLLVLKIVVRLGFVQESAMHLILEGSLVVISIGIVFVGSLVVKVPQALEFLLLAHVIEVKLLISLMDHVLVNLILLLDDGGHFLDISVQDLQVLLDIILVIIFGVNVVAQLHLVLLDILFGLNIHVVKLIEIDFHQNVVR
jgi:hypothetical protein